MEATAAEFLSIACDNRFNEQPRLLALSGLENMISDPPIALTEGREPKIVTEKNRRMFEEIRQFVSGVLADRLSPEYVRTRANDVLKLTNLALSLTPE